MAVTANQLSDYAKELRGLLHDRRAVRFESVSGYDRASRDTGDGWKRIGYVPLHEHNEVSTKGIAWRVYGSKGTGTTATQLSTATHEWHRIRMDYAHASRGCAGWCFSAGCQLRRHASDGA
eukprot:4574581-Pyramimonas_sp.AAC.1